MQLHDLPNDLLVTLPFYLDSINDLYSLILTCRGLYTACHDTKARPPLRLRQRNGRFPLQPYPHLLIAGTARQVGDWAVHSIENRDSLRAALRQGVEGLVELCVSVARMSLADMKELCRIRRKILKPLSKLVKFDTKSWSDPGHPVQLRSPELCLLNLWTYCDLFHQSITASYRPVEAPVQLNNSMRLEYLHHCLPIERTPHNITASAGGPYPRAYMISSRLAYQQLDLMHLLEGTALSEELLRRLLGFKLNFDRMNDDALPEGYLSPEYSVVDTVRHSGLLNMRFVLLRHSWAAERLRTTYHDEGVDAEVDLLKHEVLQAHANGAYRAVHEARWPTGADNLMPAIDPSWTGLVNDLEELWLDTS